MIGSAEKNFIVSQGFPAPRGTFRAARSKVASPQGVSPVASGRGSPAASSERDLRLFPRFLPSGIHQRNILALKIREVSAGSARATFAPGTPLRRAL
jgi:hypothetical protein